MEFVSNYVGELSASQFGGKQKGLASGIDMDDDTFANLLEKQLNNQIDNDNSIRPMSDFGIPAGLDIADVYGNNHEPLEKANAIKHVGFDMSSNAKNFSASEILAFFPSLFDSKPTLTQTATNGLFDFERKVAANSYGKYAKNVVTNLGEFVSDALR